MRPEFFIELEKVMAKNKKVIAVTGDLGFGGFDRIAKRFPDRFINVGAAEQAGMDMCAGLAMAGKIPFFYSITPFAIYRPFETLRTYLDHENIPVTIIGSGDGEDYKTDGFSHWATGVQDFLSHFKNILFYKPQAATELPSLLKKVIHDKKPCVIILKRENG